MTPATFRAALADLGYSQAAFAREISARSDRELKPQTVYRWASGWTEVPAAVQALLSLLRERQKAAGGG